MSILARLMEKGKEFSSQNLIENAQIKIRNLFERIGLNDIITSSFGSREQKEEERQIAILGAGAAIEIKSLVDYFKEKGLGRPNITAFDRDPMFKTLTREIFRFTDISFEYRVASLTDTTSLGDVLYDLILLRKPAGETSEWRRIFENGYDHLKESGIFIATTDIYDDFVREQLSARGTIIRSYEIDPVDRAAPYFTESAAYIATKGGG